MPTTEFLLIKPKSLLSSLKLVFSPETSNPTPLIDEIFLINLIFFVGWLNMIISPIDMDDLSITSL